MRRRTDRDRLRRGIDSRRAAEAGDRRKALREARADGLPRVEKDAMASGELRVHRARDDIARREFGAFDVGHESTPAVVDEDRAFAPHRLADQLQGRCAIVERGRVKLHEFEIAHQRAGARRDREAFAEDSAGLVPY